MSRNVLKDQPFMTMKLSVNYCPKVVVKISASTTKQIPGGSTTPEALHWVKNAKHANRYPYSDNFSQFNLVYHCLNHFGPYRCLRNFLEGSENFGYGRFWSNLGGHLKSAITSPKEVRITQNFM